MTVTGNGSLNGVELSNNVVVYESGVHAGFLHFQLTKIGCFKNGRISINLPDSFSNLLIFNVFLK